MKPIYFTKEGFAKVKEEYSRLKESRKGAVDELRRARELGDLSENAAYKVARQTVNSIDARLRRLKLFTLIGKVSDTQFNGLVGIGTTVFVNDGERNIEYKIVGDQEADPVHNKISTYSPIGKALIGKRIGDVVNIHTPSGTISYTILDIHQ